MTLCSVSEYISLVSLHEYGGNLLMRHFMEGTQTYDAEFSFLFWTWINALRIQLHEKSSTFEKLNGSKLTRKSLKGRIFIVLATFSLPSSSLLKFSIKAMVFQELMLYVLLILMNRILVKLMLSHGIIKSLKYGTSASVKRSKSGTTTSGCFLKKKRKKHWFIMRKFCINGS